LRFSLESIPNTILPDTEEDYMDSGPVKCTISGRTSCTLRKWTSVWVAAYEVVC